MATVGHYFAGLFSGFDMSSAHWGAIAFYTLPLMAIQCWQRWTGKLEFLAAAPAFITLRRRLWVCVIVLLPICAWCGGVSARAAAAR